MKLDIKLKNPKYCDGCPFLDYMASTPTLEGVSFCKYKFQFIKLKTFRGKVIRPQQCIKENGV